MPWLPDETPQQVIDAEANRLLPTWPQPQSPRVDARFRHTDGIGTPHSRASKYLFRMTPSSTSGPLSLNCWVDLSAVSDTVLSGTSGIHPAAGWEVTLTVTQFVAPAVDPNFGKSGIEYRWTIEFPGEPAWSRWQMMDIDDPGNALGIPFKWLEGYGFLEGLVGDDKDPILNPSYPADPDNSMRWWTMSECWDFAAQPVPAGGAEFNGVDTSILFDAFTSISNQRFQLQFDVELRDNNPCAILARSDNSVRWVRLKQDFFQWHGVAIPVSPILPLNEFGTFRAEFNWTAGLGTKWRLYWNGSLVATDTNAATDMFFNLMGKRGPTYFGDFDMGNLTFQDTNPASPRLLLSTELIDDACDIGIGGLKGTTENMALPSCP